MDSSRNGRLESRDLWKIPYPSGRDCTPNTLYLFWRIQRSLCACAYVRWWTESNEYDTWFIAAKSRVAPLKPLSIPRLELQAAVLATRLYQSISEESRLQFEKVVFVSDSNVLSWIRSQAREMKPFVSARVAEIQSNSDPSQWRHVPGELNVADDVSHGMPAQRLIGRWKQGPEYLRLLEEEWPQDNSIADLNEVEKEHRKTQVILLRGSPEVIDCKKFQTGENLSQQALMCLDSSGIYVPDIKQRNYPKPPNSRCNWAKERWRRKNWRKPRRTWLKKARKLSKTTWRRESSNS